MAQIVKRIFAIRSEDFRHDDVKGWVIDVFDDLFGLELFLETATEVYLGEGWCRADMIVEEAVVIEVRTSLEDELDDTRHQLEEYFGARDDLNVGVATDGIHWRFFVRSGDGVPEYHRFVVQRDWADDQLRREIYEALTPLRHVNPIPATPGELASAFKLRTPTFGLCRNLLQSIAETSSVFEPQLEAWIAEYRGVYPGFAEVCRRLGSGDEQAGARELYLRYTYLAVLVKTIAQINVLGEGQFTEEMKSRPRDVALGRPLVEAGVRIPEPGDYFSWIAEGSVDDLKLMMREILHTLLRSDLSAVSEEIYRVMYEEIVDRDTRNRLGGG
ncbi:MAG: hypothetical protein ACE5IJ_05915 [Thermoplasmata archaeon]